MEVRLPKSLIDSAIEATDSKVLIAAKDDALRFGTSNPKMLDVKGHLLEKSTLKFLYNATKEKTTEYANAIEFLYQAIRNPSEIVVKRMADVGPGLLRYIQSGKIKGYLFQRGPHKSLKAFLVTKLEFGKQKNAPVRYRRAGENIDAEVRMVLSYSENGELKTKTKYIGVAALAAIFEENSIEHEEKYKTFGSGDDAHDVHVDTVSEEGLSIDAVLRYFGYFIESAELHEHYEKQVRNYFKYVKMYGQQFRVRGTGEQDKDNDGWGWYSYSSEVSMMVDGKPGRTIMNTIPNGLFSENDQVDNSEQRKPYYGMRRRRNAEENADSQLPADPEELRAAFDALDPTDYEVKTKLELTTAVEEAVAPMHPTLRVFHLHKMADYTVHVNCLRPYEYKADIRDQLILPEEVKQLTEMLVASSTSVAADVVEGKSQSTILACIGDPGLGKTLLAEVMSEACQKPLYKIQAAQLGLDANALETNLQRILAQAQRWNAVLMIDEANAYVHSRGHDIKQNAIVGVFLRLLEFYRGVMILTTNMTNVSADGVSMSGFDIDDAILQRCAAVFKFELPDKKMAGQLWRLQAKLMDAELDNAMVKELTDRFKLSGRSIRNLLKLSTQWARKLEQPLSMEHFNICSKVIPLTRSESIKEDK